MLGCRRLWQSALVNTYSRASLNLHSRHAGQNAANSMTPKGKSTSLESVQDRLNKLTDSLKSDAHTRMLASPLRKCAIVQLILPNAMMFRMISQSNQQAEDSCLEQSVNDARTEEGQTVRKRRSRRYVMKEAKKDKKKALLQAQRLTLHKQVTSITTQSRERFSKQLIHFKEQLNSLEQRRQGQLMPFGLTKESIKHFRGMAQGRAIWCTLNKNIVKEMLGKSLHRTLPSTSPLPSDLLELLQEALEKRVVEEASLLFKSITNGHNQEGIQRRWLVRRLKGAETASIMTDGLIKLRDDGDIHVACLILKEGVMPILKQEVDSYDLQTMIRDDERRNAVEKSFQSIAIILNRIQRRQQRQMASSERQIDTVSIPDQSSEEQTVSTIQQGSTKWPRILAIKRDERTVDLCIALWRLNAWYRSDQSKEGSLD